MRDLTFNEVEEVDGGIGFLGAAIGGLIGGVSAALSGGSFGNVAGAVAFGAVSGFFGGVASAATGVGRVAFATDSAGTGVASSVVGSSN